jgi:hypothetical protein
MGKAEFGALFALFYKLFRTVSGQIRRTQKRVKKISAAEEYGNLFCIKIRAKGWEEKIFWRPMKSS